MTDQEEENRHPKTKERLLVGTECNYHSCAGVQQNETVLSSINGQNVILAEYLWFAIFITNLQVTSHKFLLQSPTEPQGTLNKYKRGHEEEENVLFLVFDGFC